MGERKMGNVFGVKKIIAAGLIFFVYSFIMAANDSRPERASNIEKARQLRAAGKFTESIKILENEVSQKPGGQSSPELAECWLNLALNYWNLGEITRAENAFIFVQALADKKGEEAIKNQAGLSLEIIRLYREAKLKRQEKKYQEAEALFLSGINLAQKYDLKDMELKLLLHIGLVYRDQEDFEGFLSVTNKALQIATMLNSHQYAVMALNNIGVYYSTKRHLFMGLIYFQKALSLAEKENLIEIVPECLTNVANISYQLGQYSLAVYYLEKALKIFEKQDDLASTISVLYTLALSIYRQKEGSSEYFAKEQPQALLKTALELSRRARNETLEARILNNLGYISIKDNLDLSEQYLNLSLAKGVKLNDKEVISSSLNNLATINLNRKKIVPALRLYNQALQEARKLNNWEEIWKDCAGLADCYEELGDYSRALAYYRQALMTFEKVRDNIGPDFYKIGFDHSKRKVYEGLIRILVKVKNSRPDSGVEEELLNTLNQIKARVFLEEMDTLQNSELQPKSPEELAELDRLINDFFSHSDHLKDGDSPGELLELENRYLQLWRAESDVENRNGNNDNPAWLSLENLQENFLGSGKIILDYLLGQTESYCFLLSQNNFLAFCLPPEKEIEKSVKLYIKLLADPSTEQEDLLRVGFELGRLLLPQPGSLPAVIESLTIIPDGILNYLPFETLRLTGGQAGGREEYLVEKHPVSYGFSLAALYKSAQTSTDHSYKKEFLGFGNPAYDQKEKGQILSRLYFADNRGSGSEPQLASLPFSQQEIKSIAALFPAKTSDLFLQKKATEDQIKALDLSQYRIIHLACHGLVSEQFPLRSSLILTARKNSQEDGFLTIREIYQLRLKSELAVLSACESSRGLVEKIEGVIGLPRIFLLIGCRSVISSLWAVNDLATQELMLEFYRGLLTGKDRSEALRQAKLKMIRSSKSHPYYWAAFVLIGEARNIY